MLVLHVLQQLSLVQHSLHVFAHHLVLVFVIAGHNCTPLAHCGAHNTRTNVRIIAMMNYYRISDFLVIGTQLERVARLEAGEAILIAQPATRRPEQRVVLSGDTVRDIVMRVRSLLKWL